jgi:alkylhydroperoxidase/carboxymuconolactone decarboxylase family protein YurZ
VVKRIIYPDNSYGSEVDNQIKFLPETETMKISKQILDYEFSEVLDIKTRELIRVACAVAVNCPD